MQPWIPCASRLACRTMRQGGRADELARRRMTIDIEYNTPAKPRTRSRQTALSQHPPKLSFEEKDAVSALGQFLMTRLLSVTNEASRPRRHYRQGSAGTLISCVQPCRGAQDGSDGSVLRGGRQLGCPARSQVVPVGPVGTQVVPVTRAPRSRGRRRRVSKAPHLKV